jgi:hypothetical protein
MTTANDLAVRHALGTADVEFIDENGDSAGVRLRHRQQKKAETGRRGLGKTDPLARMLGWMVYGIASHARDAHGLRMVRSIGSVRQNGSKQYKTTRESVG